MRAAKRWGALVAGIALVVTPAAAAAAADRVLAPGQALTFDRLAPGFSKSDTMTVTNPSESAAEVSLTALAVNDEENGCLRPQTRVASGGCDADGGELSQWLDVTVAREGTTLWSGPMSDLEEVRHVPGTLPAGETWELELTLGLPMSAGNDTMTDQVSFDLRVAATTDTGDEATEVLGVQTTAPDAGSGGDVPFPIVAVDAGLAGLTSLGLGDGEGVPGILTLAMIGAGVVLVGVSVRPRRPQYRHRATG